MTRITNWDAVLASSPLDTTAASVVSESADSIVYETNNKFHWKAPPSTFPWPTGAKVKNGHKFGRMVVVGYLGSSNDTGARYLVRCSCGDYESRRARAILNPANDGDKCHNCRHIDNLRKREKFLITAEGRAWSLANCKPLLGNKEGAQ